MSDPSTQFLWRIAVIPRGIIYMLQIKLGNYRMSAPTYRGRPCARCEGTLRYMRNNLCVTCARNNNKKNYKKIGKSYFAKYHADWRKSHVKESVIKSARSSARARGIIFDITTADIVIEECCPVCGVVYKDGKEGAKTGSLRSIDRLDNEKGYVPGNISVICIRCNDIKHDASIEHLRRVLEWWEKRLEEVKHLPIIEGSRHLLDFTI